MQVLYMGPYLEQNPHSGSFVAKELAPSKPLCHV